jgi:hypothetical protein
MSELKSFKRSREKLKFKLSTAGDSDDDRRETKEFPPPPCRAPKDFPRHFVFSTLDSRADVHKL